MIGPIILSILGITSTNGGCRRIVWSNGPGHDYEYCQRRFVPDFVGDGNDWSQGPH